MANHQRRKIITADRNRLQCRAIPRCGAARNLEDDLAAAASRFKDLYNIAQDPSEKNNLAAANLDKVAALQQRLNALAKESVKPLFLVDQMKVVMKNMNGEPVLPGEDEYYEGDTP